MLTDDISLSGRLVNGSIGTVNHLVREQSHFVVQYMCNSIALKHKIPWKIEDLLMS